jgi:glycosyltransferase involved in cell wall biosynthesis
LFAQQHRIDNQMEDRIPEKRYNITLSAFFPCFNEESNIPGLVAETVQVLERLVKAYEIILIDDGSTDRTPALIEILSKQHDNIKTIRHKKNRGYGAALISGFNHAAHDWVFFSDGDRQFSILDIERLLREIEHYDLIIGFRKKRQDHWHRALFAWAWNQLIRTLFDLNFKDIDCAFKLVRKKRLENIGLTCSGAMISTEFLLRMQQSGARIKEVGVTHRPRRFGTQSGNNIRVIYTAFSELLSFRQNVSKIR